MTGSGSEPSDEGRSAATVGTHHRLLAAWTPALVRSPFRLLPELREGQPMSTTDTRDEQIEALTAWGDEWLAHGLSISTAAALLDGPVAAMIAQAERGAAARAGGGG